MIMKTESDNDFDDDGNDDKIRSWFVYYFDDDDNELKVPPNSTRKGICGRNDERGAFLTEYDEYDDYFMILMMILNTYIQTT